MIDAIKASFNYGRFFLVIIMGVISIPFMLFCSESLIWVGAAFGLLVLLGELFFGKDLEDWEFDRPELFYPLQYIALVGAFLTQVVCVWLFAAPEVDMLGIGASIHSLTGFDTLAAREESSLLFLATSFLLSGATISLSSVVVGHELTHRKDRPVAHLIGRLGQCPGYFTYFSIRHPYGHHNLVATPADPATALRGENYYHFSVRSIIGQYKMTWDLEKTRLTKMGLSTWSWKNEAMRWWIIEAIMTAGYIYLAGWVALPVLILFGLTSHFALEAANYIEHYGLVRVPTEPMQLRHSWNSNERMANWVVCAVPRHSHHHADADVEFWELKSFDHDAPTTILGYIPSMLLAMVPTLWHPIMNIKLMDWDNNWANPEERKLANIQSMASGQSDLIYHAQQSDPTLINPNAEVEPAPSAANAYA